MEHPMTTKESDAAILVPQFFHDSLMMESKDNSIPLDGIRVALKVAR
jgi:hypothetical protein